MRTGGRIQLDYEPPNPDLIGLSKTDLRYTIYKNRRAIYKLGIEIRQLKREIGDLEDELEEYHEENSEGEGFERSYAKLFGKQKEMENDMKRLNEDIAYKKDLLAKKEEELLLKKNKIKRED